MRWEMELTNKPVVECKNCKYCNVIPVGQDRKMGAVYECNYFKKRFNLSMYMMPNDYCSKGRLK